MGAPYGDIRLPGVQEFALNIVLVALGMCGLHIIFHQVLSATSSRYNRIPQLAEQRKQNSKSDDNGVKNGGGSRNNNTATTPEYKLPLIGMTAHVLTCQDLVAIPVSGAICVYYLRGVLSFPEGLLYSWEDRWLGRSHDIIYGIYIHAAFSIYEVIIYSIVGKQYEFYLHHVLVVWQYGTGLILGRLLGFLACAGLVEVTNVFLSSLSMMGRMDLKTSPLYLGAGVGLYVSYVMSRLILLPITLGCLFYDIFTIPASVVNEIRVFLICSTGACLVILSMSCLWFSKIHAGLMKHLYGKGGDDRAGSELDATSHGHEHSNGHHKSQ